MRTGRTPSRNRRRITLGAAFTAVALMMSGCVFPFGGSSSTSPAPSGDAITGIDQARSAVVRIVAEGSYVDPTEGLVASAGSGSGFIIDPEGHVVTNAHVVEGAGLVRVYVDGRTDPVNARILGVSECNDLAVLDLNGDGYSYLAWNQTPVDVGLEVYTAGYPLGDPEYSLTRGIISKARADGDSSWASLDYTLEHDAAIQPGNSGGPLLDVNARVVGVNYAASDPTNTSQYFAIPGDLAQSVVATLTTGQDVETLGINGLAWYDYEADVGGLWVSGVRAGSAASNAGVEAGDIVLSLAGRDVVTAADQATKSGYCDVLRTQGQTAPMEITVYRPSTGEYLKGEVNNPAKPLQVIGSTDPEVPDGDAGTDVPAGYRLVMDPNMRIATVAPEGWEEITQSSVNTDVGEASGFIVTPDNNNFLEGDGTSPGILVLVFEGKERVDLRPVRNFMAEQIGFTAMCTTGESTNEPTLENTRFERLYYVDTYFYNCSADGMEGYVTTMWFPDDDLLVAVAATSNTDRQYEAITDALQWMDVL